MRTTKTPKIVWKQKVRDALRRALYYLLVAIYVATGSTMTLRPVKASSCVDVQFVFARGSGEKLNGPSYNAWRTAIEQRMKSSIASYDFYELGTAEQAGHKYPAATVSGGVEGVTNLIGAAISGGALFKFGESVDEGAAELKAYYSSTLERCPNTKFILGGYSQGAMLISRTLDELDSSKIIYISTFGDPKLYLPEGKRRLLKKPEACYGRNLSNYRTNVSDCYAYEGVLGSYQPYQPEGYIDKLGAWCNKSDIMCSSKLDIGDHTSYISENFYDEAGAIIVSKISDYFGTYETSMPNALHEVAFLIDNTDSMHYVHDEYRDTIQDFAARVAKSGGRIALFEFGELAEGTKTLKQCGFDCSIEEFEQKYDNIDALGGGDRAESALSGLMTTMNSLDWTNGATKSIVLLTDALYHSPDRDGTTLDDVVKRSLEIDPVNMYVIKSGDGKEQYSELVERTNGGIAKKSCTAEDLADQILSRPVAKLKLMQYQAEPGSLLEFDASDSYAENGSELSFAWDLDGDGEFERTTSKSIVQQEFSQPFDGYIQVKATDSNGRSATMSARVEISEQAPEQEPSTITEFTSKEKDNSYEINFETTGERVLLSSSDTPIGWVEITAGAGSITISELRKNEDFSLTPYSKEGIRGERYGFKLRANNKIEADSGPTPSDKNNDPGANKSDSAPENNSEQDSTQKNPKPSFAAQGATPGLNRPVLPKVPNAGAYSNDR